MEAKLEKYKVLLLKFVIRQATGAGFQEHVLANSRDIYDSYSDLFKAHYPASKYKFTNYEKLLDFVGLDVHASKKSVRAVDCCVKECVFFRGVNAELQKCPKCNEDRQHLVASPYKKNEFLWKARLRYNIAVFEALPGGADEVIDMCVGDCLNFRNEYSELLQCPVCDESRYEPIPVSGEQRGDKRNRLVLRKPRRSFLYWSIERQLRNQYANLTVRPQFHWYAAKFQEDTARDRELDDGAKSCDDWFHFDKFKQHVQLHKESKSIEYIDALFCYNLVCTFASV